MTFTTTAEFLIACFGEGAQEKINELRWRTGGERVVVDTDSLEDKDIEALMAFAEQDNKSVHAKLRSWKDLQRAPDGENVKSLQHLEVALREYIREAPHKFLFMERADGQLMPWLVTKIEYHKGYSERGYWHPPHTDISLCAIYKDKEITEEIEFTQDDLVESRKRRVSQLLARQNAYRETPEAFEKWEEQIKTFREVVPLLGTLFDADGYGFATKADRWGWHSKDTLVSLTVDGRCSRVIIDQRGDPDEEEDARRSRSKDIARPTKFVSFWPTSKPGKSSSDGRPDGDEEVDADEKDAGFLNPVHPYVHAFSLNSHSFLDVCVTNLRPYKYKTDLGAKLILPEHIKNLVNVLVSGAAANMEDIVSGKAGGVIVIATGEPGTGKTLTAEVYSEQVQRPLYVVQCAQLGTDEEELEGKLGTILHRANRWGAILLIDEADVYVRARENDIQQNAIVGVFLRLLERFAGVLFMTSNRATAIDDAILSRAIAHIKYQLPNADESQLIWEVLSENYGVDLFPKEIKQLVDEYPKISGRNIKNLLKLATTLSRKSEYKKSELSELIKSVSRFIDFPKAHYAELKKRQDADEKPAR